jgi:hypothetical protein
MTVEMEKKEPIKERFLKCDFLGILVRSHDPPPPELL